MTLEDKLAPPFIAGENGTSEEIADARGAAWKSAGGGEEGPHRFSVTKVWAR